MYNTIMKANQLDQVFEQKSSAVGTSSSSTVAPTFSLLSPVINQTPLAPAPFNEETPESEITHSDIELANVAAKHIYAHWCAPFLTTQDLSRLFKTTVEFTRHRRKILNMSYDKETERAKRAIVCPVD